VPEVLSVCSVQYKCVTDAQRRKASLPGRGLEYVDADGGKHQVMPCFCHRGYMITLCKIIVCGMGMESTWALLVLVSKGRGRDLYIW
jgi:hypothetical protein